MFTVNNVEMMPADVAKELSEMLTDIELAGRLYQQAKRKYPRYSDEYGNAVTKYTRAHEEMYQYVLNLYNQGFIDNFEHILMPYDRRKLEYWTSQIKYRTNCNR